MTTDLLSQYLSGAITADHLVVEVIGRLDPEHPGPALAGLPDDLLHRIAAYVRGYVPGKMRTNHGRTPAPEQVEAARSWLASR